ncbi:cobalamin (vitamin B12) biosynthesis CbiG protein [Methanothermus fervidus DSM 2088]|uniref:Cobalamin (Vitamin B12) biosynthesis CbiG protein n=1 Tax=Methanothermus fervidus (strain ATCC 43054 / DSM 2088 / JCM 10308 / V24 S) TaxID=523846 RepID=E3GZK0_METFV|nr:cobalt-precorrin 5A hydrolase [Methanothermus fervidus]ADP77732.1 cobalamin (vitamin B12) biosynthesis CbiG protein [Methanothermus fervidus DSM 2088]
MRVMIISITEQGEKIADKIYNKFKNDPRVIKVSKFHKNVKSVLKKYFKEYDVIIGIMATGIMVRSIVNLLSKKYKDPGVIVIDDAGKNVISLLSGHLGGANELTKEIAEIINANPVITTSTDVHGFVGIDSLAKKYYWKILNPELIVEFNSAILKNKTIKLLSRKNLRYIFKNPKISRSYSWEMADVDGIQAILNNKKLKMVPLNLVIGIGTKKNIEKRKVIEAINDAVEILKIDIKRIDALATGEMKKNEVGLLDTAKELNLPLLLVKKEELKNKNYPSDSKFVRKKFGIGSVCEPAALHVAGKNSQLILRKITRDGVAVAAAVGEGNLKGNKVTS